jgi:hypothetical protein
LTVAASGADPPAGYAVRKLPSPGVVMSARLKTPAVAPVPCKTAAAEEPPEMPVGRVSVNRTGVERTVSNEPLPPAAEKYPSTSTMTSTLPAWFAIVTSPLLPTPATTWLERVSPAKKF